jgi:hypothetical protein
MATVKNAATSTMATKRRMPQHQQWSHREDCSSINNGHIEKIAAASTMAT